MHIKDVLNYSIPSVGWCHIFYHDLIVSNKLQQHQHNIWHFMVAQHCQISMYDFVRQQSHTSI